MPPQCDSYLRLIKESLVAEESYADVDTSIEVIMVNADEDKMYAAMGVAKTIGTVHYFVHLRRRRTED